MGRSPSSPTPWPTGCKEAHTGILRGRGVYGNLPAGEVFVAPVEDGAEGVLVVDKTLPGLELSEPVRLLFEEGKVVSIEGEPGAGYLERAPGRRTKA